MQIYALRRKIWDRSPFYYSGQIRKWFYDRNFSIDLSVYSSVGLVFLCSTYKLKISRYFDGTLWHKDKRCWKWLRLDHFFNFFPYNVLISKVVRWKCVLSKVVYGIAFYYNIFTSCFALKFQLTITLTSTKS